ncbi:uncharacterized protein LOC131079056 isoform X1 [Cryptomeria japonica]|uniref:uncharacterized protein LOC131079056 isoform X1 n=2 Tax=Cryptomeria japonica TaxID=3369 RepID=UPI0027DA11A4|nr:uncharacterized protein LOC131079056 isoform X1 [Cryptomeria japonica]XP_057872922.2 uncharacterized protein LOC131079056 isoform X1 [Cryptomeria japonica]
MCASTNGHIGVGWKHLSSLQAICLVIVCIVCCRMLTWEDGYCNFAKPSLISTPALGMPDLFLNGLNFGGNSLDDATPSQDENSLEDKIGLAVAKMSYQVFSLGDGIIGHVAYTGKHQWILVENNGTVLANPTGAVNDHLMIEAGWQNQFAAGIKTIALIGVLSHGVVQLGSTHLIMENLELVKHIRTLFLELQNVPGVFVSEFQEASLTVKNQVPVLAPMPSPPNRIELPILQGIPVASIQDYSNLIFQEKDNSKVLVNSSSPLGLELRGSKTQPCLFASACSSDTSAKISRHSSPLQINSLQLRSSSPTVNNYQGGKAVRKIIPPSTYREMHPFQFAMQTMVPSSDNQQTLHAAPDQRKSCMPTINKNIQKTTDCQWQFDSSMIRGKNSIQHQMDGSIKSGSEQGSTQSSLCKAETNGNGNLLGSGLTIPNKDEKAPKKRLFSEQDPYLKELKHTNMMSSLQTCHKGVYLPGDTSAYLKSAVQLQTNEMVAALDITPMAMGETDIGKATVLDSPLSLVGTCTSGSHSKHVSKVLANVNEEPNTEVLCSDIAPFWNGVTFSEELKLEQCWLTEILEKNEPPTFQNDFPHKLSYTKVGMEDTGISLADISSLKNDQWENIFQNDKKKFKLLNNDQHDDSQHMLQFSACTEMSKTLEPYLTKLPDGDIWNEMLLPKSNLTSPNLRDQSFEDLPCSVCFSDMDVGGTLNNSADRELALQFLPETDSGHLLNAVIGNMDLNVCQRQDDDISGKSTGLRLSTKPFLYTDSCLAGEISRREQKQSELIGIPHIKQTLGKMSSKILTSSYNFQEENAIQESPSEAPLNIQCDAWIDEDEIVSDEELRIMNLQKFEEPVTENRKEDRPGDSARLRPKDRQQIQDCVRELREIIPGGTKCSIDSLLERTIKHLTFLQCVTEHVDRLKISEKSKMFHKEGSFLARDELKGGPSWALELDGQMIRCPVIVENLDQPQQMLVEMLCEEQGLFLEIADTLRGLGLIILNSFMESRHLKMWAHFVVETNRNAQLHRMEVLWSLMHLLQPHAINYSNGTCQPVQIEPRQYSSAHTIP